MHERPLGGDAGHRGGIVDGGLLGGAERVRARLQGQRTLAGGRHQPIQRPSRGIGSSEPLQPGQREHQRVGLTVGELAQAGVDVAAHPHDLEVRPDRMQLGGAPQA